ncbi:IS21 family transposase, partial [Polynucleobacter sp. MG-28-Ekke-A2]|uniref:IS21 family transposase n=1 Tax=Polynucleobacter sp. MG-28-Ekke-A2 TaxID=3108276 RepID=UPI002B229338
MSSKAITMRKIKEVLRLRFECHLSMEAIARSLELSKGVVVKYCQLACAAKIDWKNVQNWDEARLRYTLTPNASELARATPYVLPNFALIHQELKNKCMTLQLLWHEYVASTDGKTYSYSAFCEHYSRFTKTLKLSMRQIHKAGEKCFVDYAGPTIPIIDVLTGEITKAQIFVAVLGASSYTFALATRAQKTEDWLLGHRKAFEYFGGVTQVIVPDNPRSLVANPDRYEPQ